MNKFTSILQKKKKNLTKKKSLQKIKILCLWIIVCASRFLRSGYNDEHLADGYFCQHVFLFGTRSV